MKIKMIPLLAIVMSSMVLTGCLKQDGQQEPRPEQTQRVEQDQDESFSGSLKELLGLGKKIECSWQFDDLETGSSTSGVVYIDGDRSRSEISMRVAGEDEMNMNLISISDGKMNYMWTKGQKIGTKFDIAEMEKLGQEMQVGENGEYQNQAQDSWGKAYDYKCKVWRVDELKFVIPTDIEFVDMGQQMEQMQEQAENMKQSMQGMCDGLPEPEKSRCLESM